MICKKHIRKQYFVFSRWSRKSWALFSAIGKQIKIGAVALRLGDMAYKRTLIAGSFISTGYLSLLQFSTQQLECDSGQPSFMQSTQMQSVMQQQSIDSVENVLLYHNRNQRCCM